MQTISLCWFAVLQQTSAFRRQKIGLLNGKFNAQFNELSFFSERNKKWPKMVKTKVVRKNANQRRSEAKG